MIVAPERFMVRRSVIIFLFSGLLLAAREVEADDARSVALAYLEAWWKSDFDRMKALVCPEDRDTLQLPEEPLPEGATYRIESAEEAGDEARVVALLDHGGDVVRIWFVLHRHDGVWSVSDSGTDEATRNHEPPVLAGALVRAAAMRARAQAITTRDNQFLVVFLDESRHAIRSVVDPTVEKEIEGEAGTLVTYDENARAGGSDWLQPVGEPLHLPRGTRFLRGVAEGRRFPSVVVLRFLCDGSLVMEGVPDRPAANLRLEPAFYRDLLEQGEAAPWVEHFDLVVANGAFTHVCLIDFTANTGDVEILIFP